MGQWNNAPWFEREPKYYLIRESIIQAIEQLKEPHLILAYYSPLKIKLIKPISKL